MEIIEFEVFFHEFCKRCTHEKESDAEDPCNECLANPFAENTHKPVNFESKN